MRNDSIDNFRIELNKPSLHGSFYVRQGDTRARTIHITITDNGKIVDLSDAKICELLIKKPDNNQNDQTMVRVGNELQYTLRTQDINVAGECLCQVMVTFKDGTFLTTPTFSVMVYQKEVDQNLEKSTNEYTALSAIILDVEGTQAEINSYVDEKTNEITEIATTATTAATTAATNASASATAASNSADDAEDQADAAARSASDCATYASNCAGLASNCASYLDDVTGIAATKLDKTYPSGQGLLTIDTVKATNIVANGDKVTLSKDTWFTQPNNSTYNLGKSISDANTSINNNSIAIDGLKVKMSTAEYDISTKLDKTEASTTYAPLSNPTLSGEITLYNDSTLKGYNDIGVETFELHNSTLTMNSFIGTEALYVEADISGDCWVKVNGKIESRTINSTNLGTKYLFVDGTNVGTKLSSIDSDIAELKNNPSGITTDTKAYIDGRTDYSYSDTVIGKWADGKNLHRVVIETTTPSASGSSVNVASLNSNADVKNIGGTIQTNANRRDSVSTYMGDNYYISTWADNGYIKMKVGNSMFTQCACEIIVEYTLNDEATLSDDGIVVLSEGGDE